MAEAGVGEVAAALVPGAIAALALDDEVASLLIPVDGVEVFVAAGDADAGDVVEGVERGPAW